MGTKGTLNCAIGELIFDEPTCKNACKYFSLPEGYFKPGTNICYKGKKGDCHQNGRNNENAIPICKTQETQGKSLIKFYLNLFSWISMQLMVSVKANSFLII